MKNGCYGGVYYISASVLGSYVYDRIAGVKKWLKIKGKQSNEAKQGILWHEKMGYNNKEMFSREMILDDNTVVVLFGVPDSCGEVIEEFKTVGGYRVSKKKLESARVQLMVYLYILDKNEGRVVYMSRRSGNIIYVDNVKRDDELLKDVVKKFISDVEVFSKLLLEFPY